ncbi:MAG: twin-arginine translocase TatA/TatE family subunit [Muribaculaceae bacterium]|nr:twin-arginine translocase TatA/TatE family subunit [Muribaculaceae bacterium]
MYILSSIPLLFNLGTGEIVLIALVVLLLFGGRKIPELMRGIGKGVRGFKQGLNEIQDEISNPVEDKKDDKDKKEDKTAEKK